MVRGRPPAHTRDEVVAAAIALADAEGLAAVTMRRVAASLGAGAMSLYTYVDNRDRLLDLMVDGVGAPPVALTGDWRQDVVALAGAQRALMLAHPWLPSALPNRRLSGRNTLAYLEAGLTALEPTGLDGATRMEIIALVTGFVASYVMSETGGRQPTEEQVAALTSAVASGEFPRLAAALADGGQAREPDFERIARWMITGLIEQAQRGF
ncbi:TetR family transcriptional regulator [Actinoplanes sp. TBRC 11911]|uniref:TetR/AcrR family transcriptional regulator n=1 Tax=Actinoplanes sp. TBRC 11911 TaxID=2729386 RepID=UPI00145E8B7E|nr:TetR/AcrR family transcriptional regulator C-terminal domain-containing protein [Actinoplanes sp. TBRC 11911]NMO57867.1 TetR family transcriptional regulator [Actinoplanes sp. TBRC 11911]